LVEVVLWFFFCGGNDITVGPSALSRSQGRTCLHPMSLVIGGALWFFFCGGSDINIIVIIVQGGALSFCCCCSDITIGTSPWYHC